MNWLGVTAFVAVAAAACLNLANGRQWIRNNIVYVLADLFFAASFVSFALTESGAWVWVDGAFAVWALGSAWIAAHALWRERKGQEVKEVE